MTPRRRNRIQIISTTVLFVIVLVFVIYHIIYNSHLLSINHTGNHENRIILDEDSTVGIFKKLITHPKSEAFKGEKLIHLDLKGAPPLVSYFKEFFPYIKKFGATGVLIEYEDMFSYTHELEGIKALNAYQPSTIETIRDLAETNNLMLIPLIQTFGHFEFVLKLEKYKDMREVSAYPQVLCPSHEKALIIIKKMIDQILKAHPEAKYIHIGCDEVLYLGECDKCKSVMNQNDWNTAELFLNHVKHIALYINKTYPGVRPIMWGDMIGRFNEKLLTQSKISSLVDVMIWKYVPDVSNYITEDLLDVYAKVFKNVWIASAFKGATGANQKVTDVKYHLENHVAWMKIVSKWKNLINFKGIVLTGWQRYDHFAVLCELLTVGIPSLTICLSYLNGSEKGTRESDLLKILQCDSPFSFSPFTYEYATKIGQCNFPGFQVYQLVNKLYTISMRISNHFAITNSGWFSFYNILHKFSSPAYVKDIFEKWPVSEDLVDLKQLEQDLRKALLEMYDVYTVEEWITSNVTPIRIRLEALNDAKDFLVAQTTWPRRPLLNSADDIEKSTKEMCASGRKYSCALLLT